jgi:hypothetical protein
LAVHRQILEGMAKHLYGKRAWPSRKTMWGRRVNGKRVQFLARRRSPARHGRISLF